MPSSNNERVARVRRAKSEQRAAFDDVRPDSHPYDSFADADIGYRMTEGDSAGKFDQRSDQTIQLESRDSYNSYGSYDSYDPYGSYDTNSSAAFGQAGYRYESNPSRIDYDSLPADEYESPTYRHVPGDDYGGYLDEYASRNERYAGQQPPGAAAYPAQEPLLRRVSADEYPSSSRKARAQKEKRMARQEEREQREARREKKRGIPWILQGTFYAFLGAVLGLFARYIDLHPGTTLMNDLAVSLSDLPFWMMCAVGISVYSKNKFAAFVNVLLFFSFMDLAYYLYSWYFNGEALRRLFLFWGAAGAAASLLAPFVHWAKNDSVMGMLLSIGILCVQTILTGWSVIGLNFFWFLGSVLFLHRKSFISTLLMAFCGGVLGIIGWIWIKEVTNFSSLLRHTGKDGQESDLLRWIKTVDPQILKNYLEPYLQR